MTLREFFKINTHIALAFSGGVDSSFLLWAAKEYGADVHAYYVKSPFQPEFELEDAKKLVSELGATMTVLNLDVLSESQIASNPSNRCYYCKKKIFSSIIEAASKDGFKTLMDGTNASDDAGDRPGMVALRELEVLSPLRICGITKSEVRRLSREAGLFTWDKPAYACLATRIPTGEQITAEKLANTERAENFLMKLGFSDFRVRLHEGGALLQITEAQRGLLDKNWELILRELGKTYSNVIIDEVPRKVSVEL